MNETTHPEKSADSGEPAVQRLVRRERAKAEVIAQQIFCHAGECSGPLCFYGIPEHRRDRWIQAVSDVLANHGITLGTDIKE